MIYRKNIPLPSILTILVLSVLNFLHVLNYYVIENWKIFFLINLIFIFLIYFFNKINLKFISDWLPFLILLYVFKQSYFMVHPINSIDYDELFINLDKFIFGFNPTIELAKFSHPILTEVLQISYSTFYFIILATPLILYLNKNENDFHISSFLILYGFYLSYIGYFILPGVGPRFTLHDFTKISEDLPGLFFTEPIRNFLNYAESISNTSINAKEIVQRDLFPSGHVQLTMVSIYCAYFYKLKIKNILFVIGMLLIFATVYLRYHYFIDVLAGFIFFIFTIWSGKRIYKFYQ